MTFTTIPNEHFITLSVNLAVNMTVICLLACTFLHLIKCPQLPAVNVFFFIQWGERGKKRASWDAIAPSHSFDLCHLLWTWCWMLIITDCSGLSDNHTELLSCQENINYFILIKVARSFYIWKCHLQIQYKWCSNKKSLPLYRQMRYTDSRRSWETEQQTLRPDFLIFNSPWDRRSLFARLF